MKQNSILLFVIRPVLLLVTSFFLSNIVMPSCTKLDVHRESDHELQSRFFTLPVNVPAAVRMTANAIKEQNEIGGFIPSFAKKEGYAIWNKSIVQEVKSTTILSRDGDESLTNETLVFVPIVQQDSNFVNGFFFSRIVDDSVELHLYRANDFDKYSYGPVDELFLTAERVTLQLLELNDAVFGSRKFRITDDSLFRKGTGPVLHGEMGRTIQLKDNIVFSGRLQQAIICTETPDCWCFRNNNVCGPEHACMQNNCDLCYFCIKVTCTTVTYNGPVGTGWPPEPPDDNPPPEGGGMGGGSNCTGNNNCGQARTLITEGRLPCGGCGDGPIIVIPPDDPLPPLPAEDTCDIANAIARQMDTLYMKGKVDSVLNTMTGWQSLTYEKGFPIYKTYTQNPTTGVVTITGYYPGAVQGSSASMNVNIVFTIPAGGTRAAGQLHNHTDSGFAAPSAGDIYALLDNHTSFNHGNSKLRYEGNIVAAFNNSKYAISIADLAEAQGFRLTKGTNFDISKGDWKDSTLIRNAAQTAFDKYYLQYSSYSEPNRTDMAYEMSLAAILTEFKTGVTLFKKDTAGHFKPIIVDTRIDPSDSTKKIYIQKCLEEY